MFKVAALGIAPAGFNTEPTKNDANTKKFFHRYIQDPLVRVPDEIRTKPYSQSEITSTVECKQCQSA